MWVVGFEGEKEVEEVVVFVAERRGLPWVVRGIFFFAAPSPLSLLLFKFTLVYISSGWFILLFFLCFLGDAKSTVTVGVFGVVVEGLGDAASADVAGVADAGVTGGSGVAAAVGGAFF